MKNILILGGTGFIGVNLAFRLLEDEENIVTIFGRRLEGCPMELQNHPRVAMAQGNFAAGYDFGTLVQGQEIVFHLISTTVPTTSNRNIAKEITDNIEATSYLLEACAKNMVKKVIFLSSGGTVYGITGHVQIQEDMPTNPITSYGMQKLSIEKLLYLYFCMYGLDYRIIRLSNPYGPYQRATGIQGVVASFLSNVLGQKEVTVYGDGGVVRDYIYIDDAVNAILNISCKDTKHRLYNVGSGIGVSLKEIIHNIEQVCNRKAEIKHIEKRKVDVPVNILDISRYESEFGSCSNMDLTEGLRRTAVFMENMLKEAKKTEEIMFSIFMCARNAERTIGKAIDSVLRQTYKNWELIIVDNGSGDGTWAAITDRMEADSRIRGIHLEEGVGWAKGASLCLEEARGDYMVFLAADDFFLGDGGLSAVYGSLEEEQADIVFTGYNMVQLSGQAYYVTGGNIPKYQVYHGEDRIHEISEIMNNIYYNSFFHFVKIDLLRTYGINFYEPYFADYESMTEAMCKASSMIVLDQAVYALTENTSQTLGATTWKQNAVQWKSIKDAVCEKGIYNREKLNYMAIRIFNNNMAMLKAVSEGGAVRDKEMNPIHKTALERLQYLEEALELPEYHEMFYYAGRSHYLGNLLDCIKALYGKCMEEGYSQDEVSCQVKWVDRLLLGLYQYNGKEFVKRESYDRECFENIRQALCHEGNIGMFGYEMMGALLPSLTDDLVGIWQEITQAFVACNLRRIYGLLFWAVDIKKRGRMPEVIEIVKECMGILQQIKDCMPEEEILQLSQDLKLVAGI